MSSSHPQDNRAKPIRLFLGLGTLLLVVLFELIPFWFVSRGDYESEDNNLAWFLTETRPGDRVLVAYPNRTELFERSARPNSTRLINPWHQQNLEVGFPSQAPKPAPRYVETMTALQEASPPWPLPDWLLSKYAELDTGKFPKLLSRVFGLIWDADTTALLIRPAEVTRPWLEVPPEVDIGPSKLKLGSDYGPAFVTGLGLKHGNGQVQYLEFNQVQRGSMQLPLAEDIATEPILTLQPLVRYGVGAWDAGDVVTVWTRPLATPDAQETTDFALPFGGETVPPTEFAMRFGARSEWQHDRPLFAVHAPGWLGYELPPAVTRLRGYYGLPPGASAADNPSPSDGATFVISLRDDSGYHTELHRHTLRPSIDTPEHRIDLALPASEGSRTLVLRIDTGPRGDASSDWTYWRDLRLFAE